MDESTRINRTEAAEVLGISRATLYRWETEGIGPPYTKLVTKVFYDLNEVESWRDANLTRVEPEAANG